jgi:hypothetical protein
MPFPDKITRLANRAHLSTFWDLSLGVEDFNLLSSHARSHAEEHTENRPSSDEALLIVHPYRRILDTARFGYPNEVERRWKDNMMHAVDYASGRMDVHLVDGYPSYITHSSGLVESGLVGNVTFTHNWDSQLCRRGEDGKLKQYKKVFLTGCYGEGRCASAFFTLLYEPNKDRVVPITDAILNSPEGPLKKFYGEFEMQYFNRVGITTCQFVGDAGALSGLPKAAHLIEVI